ncbi:unnamed protein product [Ceratitis capitata]|uniref:(Mediterranean fruit fly) hypothetical protein n=1 Tax=Ceratitis capitata TaxID=7213 RepID=A0A811UDW4_CERCA|nr:unnamed protein product [Ceratitis capitata]
MNTLLFHADDGQNVRKTRTKDKYRVVYNDFQRLELEKEYCTSRFNLVQAQDRAWSSPATHFALNDDYKYANNGFAPHKSSSPICSSGTYIPSAAFTTRSDVHSSSKREFYGSVTILYALAIQL